MNHALPTMDSRFTRRWRTFDRNGVCADGFGSRKRDSPGDSVTFSFKYMKVSVSPRDDSYSYKGTTVTLPNSNNVKGKWYKIGKTDMLTFPLNDRFVTIYAPYHSLSKTKLEQVAVDVTRYQPTK